MLGQQAMGVLLFKSPVACLMYKQRSIYLLYLFVFVLRIGIFSEGLLWEIF
jgi:hypothetical protein